MATINDTGPVPPSASAPPGEGSSSGGTGGTVAMQIQFTKTKAAQIVQAASIAGDDIRSLKQLVTDLSGLLIETLGFIDKVVSPTPSAFPGTSSSLPFHFTVAPPAAAAPIRLPSASSAAALPAAKKRRRTHPAPTPAPAAIASALPPARPPLPAAAFAPLPTPARPSYADRAKASLVAQFHNPNATPAEKTAAAIKLLVKPLPIGRRLLPVTTELRDDFGAKVAQSCFVYVRGLCRMPFTKLREYVGTLGNYSPTTVPFISFVGDRMASFLCADSEVADSLRNRLQTIKGLQVLDKFDVDRPLFASPSMIVDDAVIARCRTQYIHRIAHDILRCNNLLVATCLQRQVPDLATAVRAKVIALQGVPQPRRGTFE